MQHTRQRMYYYSCPSVLDGRPVIRLDDLHLSVVSPLRPRTISFFFFFLNDPAPPESSPFPPHAPLPLRRMPNAPAPPPNTSLANTGRSAETGAAKNEVTAISPIIARILRWRHTYEKPLTSSSRTLRRRSEEHTSELQSPCNLVCRLLLEK